MTISSIFSLAKSAIRSNKLRTLLTIAIIAIGIMALIGIITVIEVLKGTINSNFSGMGANTFTITSQQFKSKGKRYGKGKVRAYSEEQSRISWQDAMLFKNKFAFPSTVSMSVVINNTTTVKRKSKKSNPNILMMASDENFLTVSGSNLLVGRNFNRLDMMNGNNTCILGYSIAKKYFGNPAQAYQGILSVGNIKYSVIGVLESKGASFVNRTDNMVMVSIANARKQYAVSDKSYVISVHIPNVKQINYAMNEAEGFMRSIKKQRLGEPPIFSLTKNDEIARSLIDNLKFITISAAAIGLITLLSAAIGLMNIMLVAVSERTREIGITKAVGATNRVIKKQFLFEAVIISLLGGFIGIVLGILIGNLLTLILGGSFVIPWLWIGIGLTLCVLVGLGAGIYPALVAARLNPINALRYE
ncbi:MAG: ABC transporter permease [Chitinophagaceae bacterium]